MDDGVVEAIRELQMMMVAAAAAAVGVHLGRRDELRLSGRLQYRSCMLAVMSMVDGGDEAAAASPPPPPSPPSPPPPPPPSSPPCT